MTRDPRTMWTDAEPDDEAAAALFRQHGDRPSATATCPAPELVQASQAGVLPPRLQERVAGHVEHCSVCQALVEALNDSSVGDPTAEEQEQILARVHSEIGRSTRSFVWSRAWQLSAVAAGVALAVAGSVFVWQSRRAPAPPAPPPLAGNVRLPDAPSVLPPDKPPASATRPTSPLPASAPTAPASPPLAANVRPSNARSVFQLEKPTVSRGSPEPGELADLLRALEPYHADDFSETAGRLRALVSRRPQSAAGHFYLGVSELFLDRNAEAVAALEAAERLAISDADLQREVAWYIAFGYRRTGQSDLAAGKLDALCRGQSNRSAQACAGLRELAASPRVEGPERRPNADDRTQPRSRDLGVEHEGVTQTIRRYEAAYAMLSAEAVRSVYPSGPIDQLAKDFTDYRSYTLTFQAELFTFRFVSDSRLSVTVRGRAIHDILLKSDERTRVERSQIVTLEKQGTTWIIMQIR